MPYFVRFLSKLLDKNIYGIYNLSSPNFISKFKFAEKILKSLILIKKYLVEGFLKRKDLVNRPINMSISNKKLTKILDMNIPTLDKQIEKMRKDYKSNISYF